MKYNSHHRAGDLEYNNPYANRFDEKRPKHFSGYSRIAYVLQGGGGLGAYQMGVVKALLESGYEPDWISATSIGAIQAAIIVGNAPEDRMKRLEQFWQRVSTYTPLDILGHTPSTVDFYSNMSSQLSLLFGQRGFYSPRWSSPFIQLVGKPDTLSFYDTSPLRQTLIDLIDFDRINQSPTSLSLGAVQVSTGQLVYFNNIHYKVSPEHIMASAALPPGFPAVKVHDEYYWDGGIHSNTPLEVILDAHPQTDTLCFVIDCFGGTPFVPNDIDGVNERSKDIGYSTHARRVLKQHMKHQRLQTKFRHLAEHLGPQQKLLMADFLEEEKPHHHTYAHICCSSRLARGSAKDYDFGRVTIEKRSKVGYTDAKAMLSESAKWATPSEDLNCRLYEAPNNLSRLMRLND